LGLFRRVEITMAIATHSSTETAAAAPAHGQAPVPPHAAPVTPGKVAMWLFLATEVMFFTGLIGSYIVFRAGSPHTSYSNLYAPATPLQGLEKTNGILLKSVGSSEAQVEQILHSAASLSAEEAKKVVEEVPHAIVGGLTPEKD